MDQRLVQVTSGPISPGNSISERAVLPLNKIHELMKTLTTPFSLVYPSLSSIKRKQAKVPEERETEQQLPVYLAETLC